MNVKVIINLQLFIQSYYSFSEDIKMKNSKIRTSFVLPEEAAKTSLFINVFFAGHENASVFKMLTVILIIK